MVSLNEPPEFNEWTGPEQHRYRFHGELHLAISRCDVDAVRPFLDAGADINKAIGLRIPRDPPSQDFVNSAYWVSDCTPIQRALRLHQFSVDVLRLLIDLLIERGSRVDCLTVNGYSLLMNAVTVGTYGSLAVAEILLDRGAPADWATQNGKTALCVACEHGNIDAVRLLMSRGATVNRRSYDVVKSASYSRAKAIKALFDAHRLAHWVLRIRLHVAGPRGDHPDSVRHETFSCRTQISRAIVRRAISFVE